MNDSINTPDKVKKFFLNKKQSLEINLKEVLGEESLKAISQVDLLETLVSECQQYPCFKFYRGASVKSLIKKDNRVEGVNFLLDEGEKKEIILADEISPDTCRLWDVVSETKLDKDRFRKDLGNLIPAYQEVAKRLGILHEQSNLSAVNFSKPTAVKIKKK